MKKTNNILLWIVQVLLAVAFVAAGFGKLSGQPMMVEEFNHLGLGQWFRFFTGGVEVFAALLLFIPAFTPYGALLLVATMLGALCAHFFVLGGNPLPAIVMLVLAAVVLAGRRNRFSARAAISI